MAKAHQYRRVDATFFDTAPVQGVVRAVLPVNAATAFASLEDGDAWPEWLDVINSVEWTSPKPFGVGTTRNVVADVGTISEEFFVWEPGRRMAFFFTEGPIPVVAAFAEDYEVTDLGGGACELVWRWGVEMNKGFGLAGKAFGAVFARNATKGLKELAKYLEANGAKYAN